MHFAAASKSSVISTHPDSEGKRFLTRDLGGLQHNGVTAQVALAVSWCGLALPRLELVIFTN